MDHDIEVSIVMPCLDEAETLGVCIVKAVGLLTGEGIRAEIVVADNGSGDESIEVAERLGARVVHVDTPGYGAALIGGIRASRGRYVIMGDADDSYDFLGITAIIAELRKGHDLVMGNRFAGGIERGAMPFLHQYLGNPVLSLVLRVLFDSRCGDVYCGLRGFRRDAFDALDLRSTGWEFALEMVARSSLAGQSYAEVPVTLSPDGRDRKPHLRTWQAGWASLRFMVLFGPAVVFRRPGRHLMLAGVALGGWAVALPELDSGLALFWMLCSALALMLGQQAASLAVFGRRLLQAFGRHPDGPADERPLGLRAILGVLTVGLVSAGWVLSRWSDLGVDGLSAWRWGRVGLLGSLGVPLAVQALMGRVRDSWLEFAPETAVESRGADDEPTEAQRGILTAAAAFQDSERERPPAGSVG